MILIFTAVCFPYFSIYGKIIMEFPSPAAIMMIIKTHLGDDDVDTVWPALDQLQALERQVEPLIGRC